MRTRLDFLPSHYRDAGIKLTVPVVSETLSLNQWINYSMGIVNVGYYVTVCILVQSQRRKQDYTLFFYKNVIFRVQAQNFLNNPNFSLKKLLVFNLFPGSKLS